eukprot:Em0423g1a
MAARSHNLRYKRYSQQPGLQYLAIGHQGADLSSQWRTDPLSPKEEIIHTIWFIGVFVFKDVVAGIAYAGVVYVGVVYSEPQGPAVQSIFVSLLIKNFAPGNVPGNASTTAPTIAPTIAQTIAPTIPPTIAPTIAQTIAPTIGPTIGPTIAPTIAPTIVPAIGPTIAPAIVPDIAPNSAPTTALMTTDSALAVILPIHKNTLETNSIQMESSHPINDAYLMGLMRGARQIEFVNWDIIQIPSSTVTVDVILCKESKAIFSSATECLCSEDYSHMIPLLEQITQHTCATQHCQALLFRHFGLGLAHYKMADHHEATKHFMEYRSLALRPADISLAHVYLGDISTIKSNYSNAAYHYLEAIHNYGTNNPSTLFKLVMPSVSALYAKQGAALKQTSQMLQAVEAFRNAIHHAPDINSRLPVHNSLGNLFQSMGDYTEALQEYKKAVKLGEELNDLVSLGWAYGNMGNAHLGLHQKDAALHHLKKALALTIEHESTPQAISRAYNNLGTAYQSLEDFKGAEENFNLALDQAVYGNDVAGQARARGNLGNLLMLNKKYERAVEQYSEVFRLSKDRQVLSTANHNRGCAYLEWAEQLRSGQNGTTSGISSNLQVLCNSGTMVPSPGFTPTELYRLGASDLTQAIELCNEVLQSTKGSMQGLSLSVSLIESSSRTFHKLQDCLIGLQQMDEALVVAEQCRARTLGERLLEKMGGGVNHLTPPLSLEQIQYIVKSQEASSCVLILHRVVEVEKLEKEKFGGKTFDQYVRQSVQEAVVGNDLELFQDVSGSQTSPLIVLFDVVVLPILDLLRKCKLQDIKSLILIPDSYTSLIPFAALHPERNFNNTFGNTFSIQMMPSLLIMGILNEAHPTRAVMYDRRTACVVGNPHIPIFEHNDEEWSLGRLPHATDEAKWISQLLKVQPLLHEQATKVAVVTKLSPAQVIHIATHGSAVSGFLAFAGPDSSNGKPSKSSDILLLPSEVEQMNIKAALVVLSSCDSGRGMVRADGIIGMGRAFLLAGAQSVLTTLWRIPDESAGMFMQFFYQYLVDGLGTTHALQKATLSVRCFRKYSQCTHWGGFQLIGRETYLHRTKTTEEALLAASLGPRCAFPQVAVVEKLEQGLIQTASQPSNVQILLGYEGTELTDPVKTFIHSFYDYFRGGVFWISCRSEEVAAACVKKALEVIDEIELKTHNIAALVVLESIGPDTLTSFSSRREMATFHKLLCHICTHIIATLHAGNNTDLSSIVGQIDTLLIRGSNIIEVEPFSPIHTIQRIVYGHLQKTKCPSPSDEDRVALEILVDITKGSPPVIDIMTSKGMSTKYPESLDAFIRRLVFTLDESEPYSNVIDKQPMKARNCVSFDLWNAINTLADLCELTSYEELFLHCLCIFHNVPVPKCVLEGLSCLIKRSYSQLTSCQEMYQKLVEFNLLKSYPHPVVLCPTGGEVKEAPPCYGVAPVVATAIWNGKMNDTDKVMALGIVYRVFEDIYSNRHILSSSELQHVFGLVCVVLEVCNCICYLIGEECYQLFYLMLERFKNICNALS